MAFQIHLAVPKTRDLIENLACLLILDRSSNSIVRAREVALGLELHIAHEVILRAFDEAVIAKFVFHLAEKNATCIHVRLRQNAVVLPISHHAPNL